jgi:hypothetical protein
VVRRYVPSM